MLIGYKNQNYDKDIIHASHNRVYENCVFQEMTFDNVWFTNTKFINCTFNSVKFRAGEFKDTCFINCMFDGVSFEYSKMGNTMFDNIKRIHQSIEVYNSVVSNVILRNIKPGMFLLINCKNPKHSIHTMLPHLTADERLDNGARFRYYYIRYIDAFIDKQSEVIDGVKYRTLHYPIALPKEQLEEFCVQGGLPKPPWINKSVMSVIDNLLLRKNG